MSKVSTGRSALITGVAIAAVLGVVSAGGQTLKASASNQLPAASAQTIKPYFLNKNPVKTIQIPGDLSYDTNGASGPVSSGGAPAVKFATQ